MRPYVSRRVCGRVRRSSTTHAEIDAAVVVNDVRTVRAFAIESSNNRYDRSILVVGEETSIYMTFSLIGRNG